MAGVGAVASTGVLVAIISVVVAEVILGTIIVGVEVACAKVKSVCGDVDAVVSSAETDGAEEKTPSKSTVRIIDDFLTM